MSTLVVANWKCHPQTVLEAQKLFAAVQKGIQGVKDVEVVICPPFVYLGLAKLQAYSSKIKLGAQNCFWENEGAFTGEIAPVMLKGLGCRYVILGHSERRAIFKETDSIVNKKIKLVLDTKLIPIFCIGETKKDRETGEMYKVLKSQIKNGLKGVSKQKVKNIVIGYEPVWAIGKIPCSAEETKVMRMLIRRILTDIYNRTVAESVRILYGGSVNSKNALSYIKEAGMDGLLIGGASLRAREFVQIIKQVMR